MQTLFGMILLILAEIVTANAQPNNRLQVFQPEDVRLVEEKLNLFAHQSDLPIAELTTQIGLSFVETPYVAATLENGLEERLVVNLKELDCTTFAEYCLSLARTVKSGKTDFQSFTDELEALRYRDGIRKLYPSRLHYFSEWIHNGHQKGIVSKLPNQNGEQERRIINFMSTHPASYPVLKEHPEIVSIIADQEKRLSNIDFQYFPSNNIPNLYSNLQHGDIVGLTSSIKGLDINHVGIAIWKNNEFYLLHASQSGEKVMVSPEPLSEFLKPSSKNSGIMIARPLFSPE